MMLDAETALILLCAGALAAVAIAVVTAAFVMGLRLILDR